MLPSSHRLLKKDFEHIDKLTLGDITRYYKKPRDITDARDKSKIQLDKSKINTPNILEKYRKKNERGYEHSDGDDDSHDNNDHVKNHHYNKKLFHDMSHSFSESISMNLSSESTTQHYNENLPISKYNHKYVKYPFANKHSKHLSQDLDQIYSNNANSNNNNNNNEDDDDDDDKNNNQIMIELCVYSVNYNAYKPFLEFMLYKSPDDDTFYFPNFMQNLSDYDVIENASMLLNGLCKGDNLIFKGRLIESPNMNNIKTAHINDRVILVYELNRKQPDKRGEKEISIKRFKRDDSFHWATVYEIFNIRKVLFYNISETVTDIFLAYTQMIKLYYNDLLIETPMVVFNGSDKNTAKYISVFSIKKSDNESRYGPFYYFTNLHNSMKYACYDRETGDKYDKGGLVRFIIYPGKIKMFLKKDKPDRSQMAKYIYDKYPIEKYTSQFRDNDCIWTENYNSAYNGAYTIDMDEKTGSDNDKDNDKDSDNDKNKYYLAMRICISDYTFQTPLSFYYINTEDIPNKYEYDFKNYKII